MAIALVVHKTSLHQSNSLSQNKYLSSSSSYSFSSSSVLLSYSMEWSCEREVLMPCNT